MGVKERRERERHELRQSILLAAREIAGKEGWQAVTIRRVAERIEYSPPTIYEHFASKDAMLLELMRLGFGLLLADMQRAAAAASTGKAQVLALAQAYWAFAWQYPELYQVMHGLGGVPFCAEAEIAVPEDAFAEADQVFELTRATLATAAPPGVPRSELEADVMLLWATLHGIVSLTMAQRIDCTPERATQLIARAVQGVLATYSKGAAV
ncbi:MAG: TetR/AcrR family transcriptional regulator [Kouleothrix sp.]